MNDMDVKYERLKEYIKSLKSVAVAFSGGVDSTFLLKTAFDVLGDKAIAVTLQSDAFPHRETGGAVEFCKKEGIKQFVCEIDHLNINRFSENPPDRCYYCKKMIFSTIKELALKKGIENVAEGSNMDDNSDYRPGLRAVKELNILSPLQEAELTKDEIRSLSKKMELDTWDKPSRACLASRFVYGEKITKEKLKMVERAEQLLIDKGYEQSRVRVHGNVARIELLPNQITKFINSEISGFVYNAFKDLGFSYVTIDLKGYRTGSMNETL